MALGPDFRQGDEGVTKWDDEGGDEGGGGYGDDRGGRERVGNAA